MWYLNWVYTVCLFLFYGTLGIKGLRGRDTLSKEVTLSKCFFLTSENRTTHDCVEFNNTSTLVGHFVSSPREREKRDRRDRRRDEIEGQGRKRNRNESEETEEVKTFPLYPYLLQG